MKKYLLIGLLMLTTVVCAQTNVTATRCDKHYARISIHGNAVDSQALAELDSLRVPIRRVDGNLLDLRELDLSADTNVAATLSTLLARFADEPLVIQADSTQSGIEFLRMFKQAREFTELDLSSDSVKAVKRLKQLAAEFRTQRQDRMDDLFRK